MIRTFLLLSLILLGSLVHAQEAEWTLDLSKAKIPDRPAAGMLFGQPFQVRVVTLRFKGVGLDLIDDRPTKEDMRRMVALGRLARPGQTLEGKTLQAKANKDVFAEPTVWIHRTPLGKSTTHGEGIQGGSYALRLDFGAVKEKKLPGKIYLALPDGSLVAGNFTVDVDK